jgi:hypothetical protein
MMQPKETCRHIEREASLVNENPEPACHSLNPYCLKRPRNLRSRPLLLDYTNPFEDYELRFTVYGEPGFCAFLCVRKPILVRKLT